MKKGKIISVVVSLMAVLFVVNTAYALLEDNLDGTVTQIRNDGSVLMWLKDTRPMGNMSWYEAVAWADGLSYAGYDDWRLPDTNPVNGLSYNYGNGEKNEYAGGNGGVNYSFVFDGSADIAFNIGAAGSAYSGSTASEMAYMYFTELGNISRRDMTGGLTGCGEWDTPTCLTNVGPFTNLHTAAYWSGTELENPSYNNTAYLFYFGLGLQTYDNEVSSTSAWAVRDVTVVPEPISSILFITGGTFLAGRRFLRRKLSL